MEGGVFHQTWHWGGRQRGARAIAGGGLRDVQEGELIGLRDGVDGRGPAEDCVQDGCEILDLRNWVGGCHL